MPKLVQVDGIGAVEFADDFSNEEIGAQVESLYAKRDELSKREFDSSFNLEARNLPNTQATTRGGPPMQLPDAGGFQSVIEGTIENVGEMLTRKEGIGSVIPRLAPSAEQVQGAVNFAKEAISGRPTLRSGEIQGFDRSPSLGAKVASGATAGVEDLAKGVADFFTTPSGLAQLGASMTPVAPAVYAKWALDMTNAGFTSVQDAWKAFKESDYQKAAQDTTTAFGAFLGAAAAAKHGYKELTPTLEAMPRGDMRGVRVEEAQQKALNATLPRVLEQANAPLTAQAVRELPQAPLVSAAVAESGLTERAPEAAANVDIRGLAGDRVKRPLTEAESTSGLTESIPLSEPVDPTMDIRRRPIELTGGGEKVQGQSVSQLESRVESEIGKEGARGSLRADWAEINADIESGMTREAALQKYVDELDASRARSDAEELARNKSYLETDEAKSAAMTPEEYKEKVMRPIYDRLVKEFKPKKKGQQPADFENWFKIGGNQENIIGNAVIRDAPINAKAAERFGIEDQLVEQGYVRDGDLYVKKSKKGGDQNETQKEEGRQEVLAPTAGETKAGEVIARRLEQAIGKGSADALAKAREAWAIEKDYAYRGLERLKGDVVLGIENAFSVRRPIAEKMASDLIEGRKTLLDKLVNLEPIKESELNNLGTYPSAITKWGYERGDKKIYTHPRSTANLPPKSPPATYRKMSPGEAATPATEKGREISPEKGSPVAVDEARLGDSLAGEKPIGMGGAVPEEFKPSQAMPSALKNASIDADRVARGEAPMAKAMRKTDPELWDEAMAVIDRDWDAADKLIARFKEQPFTPTDVEAMVLLHRRVDLKNEVAKLSREYALAKDEGRIEAAEAARASRDYIQEKFNELDSIVGRGNSAMGTMQGRAFRARQLMMNEDYSMAALISERQRDVGRKLTEAELEEVRKIADDYARKSAELEKRVEELQKQAEESEANAIIEQAAHDAVRVPKASDYVINLAEKIVADWDVRADKARARLREKFKRTNVGLDPTIIVDLAEIGLSHLGHAGLNFAKWSAKMLEEFKELDATDLKEVYAKSQELADADIIKRAPKEKVSAVKKTITQVSKDLVKSTVERVKKNVAKNPDFNIAFAARKLAREFWIRGIRDPQKMVDAVHEALKEAIPELERRETMDALSGYGKFKPLSKDEVSVGLRDINGQLQQIAKLEDMAQGQAPKKSGFERRAPSDEERRLIKQVEEKKKEGGYDVTDPETQLRTAMQAAERRLENEISDLEHQIETRTKIVKDKRKLTYDDKLQGLRDRRDFLKKVFDDIFKKPELTDAERLQQWKERTQEKIDDYQEQVVSGYFKQRKRPEPIRYDPEAIKLRYELNKVHRAVLDMRLKDELAKRNMAQKIAGGVGNTLRFVRAVMTGGEFSGVLRQGGFLFGAHPVIGAKALKQMFQALMSEEAQFKIMEEIQTRPNAPLYERSKLDFTDAGTRLSSMEEHYMFRVAESVKSIPGVKQGVKILDAFQRAYTTYLNEIRADAFDKLVDTYGNDKVTTEQIANYINVATGRGSRAVGRWTGPGMNTIFFAPRYSISRLQLLTGQPMWHGNAATRKMVAKEYARALSSAAVVYSLGLLWGKANNQSAEETIQTDPRSSDFGKIKIGNSRIDPLAGLAQWTALMAREVSGTTVNSRGKVRPLRENYRMGGHLPKRTIVEDNGLEVAERFGITKLAPGPSSVARFLAGEDFTGQKFTFANELLNAGMPITYGDIYKAMREQGVPNGTAMAILSIFGMGLQTYDVNKRKQ